MYYDRTYPHGLITNHVANLPHFLYQSKQINTFNIKCRKVDILHAACRVFRKPCKRKEVRNTILFRRAISYSLCVKNSSRSKMGYFRLVPRLLALRFHIELTFLLDSASLFFFFININVRVETFENKV